MKLQYRSDDLIIFESALFRTTTTLVIGADYILLVDPNWLPIELDFIDETILALCEGKEKYLMFTHSDYDHIIGYGRFKDYKTIASENFVKSSSKDEVLSEIITFDDAYYVNREYNIEYPQIDIIVSGDDKQVEIGSDVYMFHQATGHNHDGIMAYCFSKGVLIVGDYLCNVEFPYVYDSVQRYRDTLDKLENIIMEHDITRLVSGHGDATSDKDEMIRRLKDSRDYLDQLEAAVVSGNFLNESALLGKYDFPIIMKQFHDKNMKLAKAEFSS